jgi:hypothetical protein
MKQVCRKHRVRYEKHCPACQLESFLNSPDEEDQPPYSLAKYKGEPPYSLKQIADTVLAYRPKSRQPKPRKRKKAKVKRV